MDLQAQMLIQYLIFLKQTEENEESRNKKIVKAVNDYYLGERI